MLAHYYSRISSEVAMTYDIRW